MSCRCHVYYYSYKIVLFRHIRSFIFHDYSEYSRRKARATCFSLRTMAPPIWESSQKPLHPKCVWIDSFGASNSGRRHFIFDYNIANGHLSYAKSVYCSCNNSSASTTRQLGSATKVNGTKLYDTSNCAKNESTKPATYECPKVHSRQQDIISNTNSNSGDLIANENQIRQQFGDSGEIKSFDIESEQNFLVNRVLQWLDLASGRNLPVIKRSEYIEKTLEKFKKRSSTAKETAARDGSPMREVNSKRRIQREPIRQLSMVFDDSDLMRNESREATTGGSLNFGSIFPVTYRCSKKFLSLRRSATVPTKPTDLIDTEPLRSTTAATAKPEQRTKKKLLNKRHKIKRIDFVDDQYRAMIERQILEQSCNIQIAKRQLHIFMPFADGDGDVDKSSSNSMPSDLDAIRLSSASARSVNSNDSSGKKHTQK